jgi:hypothetical protein
MQDEFIDFEFNDCVPFTAKSVLSQVKASCANELGCPRLSARGDSPVYEGTFAGLSLSATPLHPNTSTPQHTMTSNSPTNNSLTALSDDGMPPPCEQATERTAESYDSCPSTLARRKRFEEQIREDESRWRELAWTLKRLIREHIAERRKLQRDRATERVQGKMKTL